MPLLIYWVSDLQKAYAQARILITHLAASSTLNTLNTTSMKEAFSTTTERYGIDKLELMVSILNLLDSEENYFDKNLQNLKDLITSKARRAITSEEEINLLEGLKKHLHSEPGSNERTESMQYLFEVEFLY